MVADLPFWVLLMVSRIMDSCWGREGVRVLVLVPVRGWNIWGNCILGRLKLWNAPVVCIPLRSKIRAGRCRYDVMIEGMIFFMLMDGCVVGYLYKYYKLLVHTVKNFEQNSSCTVPYIEHGRVVASFLFWRKSKI